MNAFASFDISLTGNDCEFRRAVECIADVICDQGDVLSFLLDRFYSEDDEDDIDDVPNCGTWEETISIWETHDCVWIEDLETLAIDIATEAPTIHFTIKGHIEDLSAGAGDEMDFLIYYQSGKLFSQTTDWYMFVHMDDFPNYASFCKKFCNSDGNPRYSKEDYEGFRVCADEWYVLDGGQGEFSNTAPLGNPKRIKLRR